jgi:hypothetical protein
MGWPTTWLLRGDLSLGKRLILQHIGVPAILPEISGECVSCPHSLQPRVLFETRLGDDRARICSGRSARNRFAAAEAGSHLVDGLPVAVVLHGEVLAPDHRIFGLVGELDHAVEGVPGLLLTLHDVDEEGDGAGSGKRRQDSGEQ